MLVDKMEYQGQQGGGGAQDDAFYELLSSTAMANNKKHQQQQQQQHHPQHQQFEHQQAFDSRSEEPVLPSYDFQQNSSSYGGVVNNGEDKASGMAPVVSSYPPGSPFQASRQHLPIPSFVETSASRQERGNSTEASTVAAVEQTMKKYMDDLMHMMESMTGRIGQLESSTRRLEQMVTDFKGGSDKNQGAAGGKLLLIETMLSEVQRGVQELRNKQEVMEVKSNMGKLHVSEESISSALVHSQTSLEPLPPPQSPRAPQLPETPSYPPHHPHHPHHPPPPYMVPPQLVGLAPPPPPPPPPSSVHLESHYPPSQQGGPPPQQFYSQQQQQSPPPPPPPPAHSHGPPPFSHQPELPPYGATLQGPYKGQSVSFGQDPYGNRPQQGPPSGSGGPSMYDQSGLLPPYQSQGRPAAPVYEQRQEQQMSGPPPGYSNAGYRTGQQAPSAPSSGAGGYPRLPTAQPVQHAMPTGREREGPAASSGATPLSTNRLSIDEVIDKVAVMGFSKDQVRAVVRRLTENGQSVDLNIVLDKLMNGEAGQQQAKNWFQRG